MRVGIVGVGLIGGSLAKLFSKKQVASEICCYDLDHKVALEAEASGLEARFVESLSVLGRFCELIFVCVPVSEIPSVVRELDNFCSPGTIISDVGSAKKAILEQIEAGGLSNAEFIGGHPMAGSEKEGFLNSSAEVLEGATYILTPTSKTSESALLKLTSFLASCGFKVLSLDAREHDEIVAVTSHLPHLLASMLLILAARRSLSSESLRHLVAGGFRDATRVAAGNPKLWSSILKENSVALVELLDELVQECEVFKTALRSPDMTSLEEYLQEARDFRSRLLRPVQPRVAEPCYLEVVIENKPGRLAAVLQIVGSRGINVEDLEIEHFPDQSSGILRLAIAEAENREKAREALVSAGLKVLGAT